MIKAIIFSSENVVRVKYNDDNELNSLLKALRKVPVDDVDVKAREASGERGDKLEELEEENALLLSRLEDVGVRW